MSPFKDATTEHQLKRWMRPDAHRFVRPDWRRYVRLEADLSSVFELYEQKYRPDQLRDDHGRFAYEGRDKPNRVRLASSDKPQPGPKSLFSLGIEVAKRAIEAFRSENGLYDLFKNKDGTVAVTAVNDKTIFGVNADSWLFNTRDRAAADGMRDALIRDFPEPFDKDNIGRMPNNALYHAETNALLRAARENGGSLAGQTLDVHVDKQMCNNCETVLPYVGLELGNPTVRFIDTTNNLVRTMRDGRWIDRARHE